MFDDFLQGAVTLSNVLLFLLLDLCARNSRWHINWIKFFPEASQSFFPSHKDHLAWDVRMLLGGKGNSWKLSR